MRNVISLERKVRMGKTASGQDIVVWQVWRANILCEIEVKRGREQFDPGTKQRFSEEVYRFRTRYGEVEGLDTTMRIVDENGAIYDIKAPLPDRQRTSDAIIEATLQNSTIAKKALILELLQAIPQGQVGHLYAGFSVAPAGGQAPYAFSLASGSLPAGLSIAPSTGQITGTPTVAGVYPSIVLRVTDSLGTSSDLPPISITIVA